MASEPERYLAKAQESLASARADLEAERYNSAANRAYYAAFQSAVAMLIESGIRPEGAWEHRFVISQFSGKLIRRRKVFPSRFKRTLEDLLENRIAADYGTYGIARPTARRMVRDSSAFVREARARADKEFQ